jgi:hypothetical protein
MAVPRMSDQSMTFHPCGLSSLYKANHFVVVGTDTDVRSPVCSTLMDLALDLACVIGYAIFNDCSARATQMKEMVAQLGLTKGKDLAPGTFLVHRL